VSPDFAPLAAALRAEITAYYEARGLTLDDAAARVTLDTNSTFVERRGRPLLEIVRSRLDGRSLSGLRVLDLGCGFGALSVLLAAAGAEVTGIDSKGSRLGVGRAVAHAHGLSVEFVVGRMEALDCASEVFDAAIQNNSLCYVVEPEARARALREARAALRPGGVLAIRNPNRWNPRDQFSGLPLVQLLPPAAATRSSRALGRPRSLTRVVSPPAARRELVRAGLEHVRHHDLGAGRRPRPLRLVARYQHFSALRPAG
jgi:SAM-dependent methyltransferase